MRLALAPKIAAVEGVMAVAEEDRVVAEVDTVMAEVDKEVVEVDKVVAEEDKVEAEVLTVMAEVDKGSGRGRQGRGSRTHLVSPEMAAAAAIAGHFVDLNS